MASQSRHPLPSILQAHNLQCTRESPESASILLSENQLSPSDFIELHPDIEKTLLDSFLEDDYDGRLHMITLSTSNDQDIREVVGLAFWRELDDDEMTKWMDLRRVEETLERHAHDNPTSHIQDGKGLLRSDSITWIRTAIESTEDQGELDEAAERRLVHSWIKIELVAIKKSRRSHHLGEILLACTLVGAYEGYGERHAVLHVAGSLRNVSAVGLYRKFGFLGLPEHEEGGPFEKPDGDLFVLSHIGRCLESLPWEEMLTVS